MSNVWNICHSVGDGMPRRQSIRQFCGTYITWFMFPV